MKKFIALPILLSLLQNELYVLLGDERLFMSRECKPDLLLSLNDHPYPVS